MAKCNFSIGFHEPIEQLINKAKTGITNAGGTFNGNTESGSYTVPSPIGEIAGNYNVAGSSIMFEIISKPMFLGCDRIESELRKYLSSHIA